MSAIFVADGAFDVEAIAETFAADSLLMPPGIKNFVLEKIRTYQVGA